MSNETVVTVIGNLVADPELRYTQNGIAVASLTVASTPRRFDRETNEWVDGETAFLRGSVWREYAENVAATLSKGSRVIVQGALGQRNYETKEGEKRSTFELDIYEIGPALRYARADLHRVIQDTAVRAEDWTPSKGGKRAAEPAPATAAADAPF